MQPKTILPKTLLIDILKCSSIMDVRNTFWPTESYQCVRNKILINCKHYKIKHPFKRGSTKENVEAKIKAAFGDEPIIMELKKEALQTFLEAVRSCK